MPINFTAGLINYREAALGSSAQNGAAIGYNRRLIANTGDPDAAAAGVAAYLESIGDDPGDYDINADLIAENFCLVEVGFKLRTRTSLSYATTGATTHLNQSYGTRARYAAPGRIAPDYQGAIGVDGSTVNGVDVTVPAFNFAVRKRFKFVSSAYIATTMRATGKVNSVPWEGFAAGEVLFLGCDGLEDEQNYVDLTYQFAMKPNQAGLTFGDIVGVEKRGWEYLWVKHEERVVGDLVLTVPAAVYVEQVYPVTDLGVLGLSLGLS